MYSVLDYLNTRVVKMPILERQISWLAQWQPRDAELLPKVRLLWLAIKLAKENHQGRIQSHLASRKEFVELSRRIYEEDAPLSCFASLNLAVSYMNELDFESARNLLSIWLGKPPEIAGLLHHGMVLSSCGQIESFLGDHEKARKYYHDAIDTFSKLSNPDEAARNIDQTRSYLVVDLMDAPEGCGKELQLQLRDYFEGTIGNAALRLGGENQYHHHVLLRYLAMNEKEVAAREKYLAQVNSWQVGAGHPWELIEFYRALLLTEKSEVLFHLHMAYDLAVRHEEAATMKLIATVILGAICCYDESALESYEKMVESTCSVLPLIGARAEVLRIHAKKRLAPLELAKAVLPFNFR